ncbi:MAG TPA: hypothetical protein VGB79_02520 [Allosphingosinicella sp.]|jgi:hypothetical protein
MNDRHEAPAELTAEEIEAVSGGDGGYLGSGNVVGGGIKGSGG